MSQYRGPFSKVKKAGNPYGRNAVDVKELYLKGEILRQGNESTVNFDAAQAGSMSSASTIIPSAPTTGGSATDDVYLYFDSVARDFTSDLSNGAIKFLINNINNQTPVDNVISIRINSFYFPRVSAAATVPDYFFFGRVYVLITSPSMPSSQSVLAQNGNRYHFECEIQTLNSVAIKLIPIQPVYYFPRPVQSISELTFNFYTPLDFKSISIPNDTLQVVAQAGTNPAQFFIQIPDNTSAIAPVGVPTAPGVAIYIQSFKSVNPTLNNTVNSAVGYFADNIISLTTFSVSLLDFTTLAVNTPCIVIVAKNRVGIETRFKSIRGQLTNGIVATNM